MSGAIEYGAPYVADSVWASIYPEPNTGCWLWGGRLDRDGYGSYFTRALPMGTAHRQLYALLVGPIPVDLEIDHLCRVRWCVNPEHLEPVTHQENSRRQGFYVRPNIATHCPHGHERTPESTYLRSDGRRACRPCDRERKRRNASRDFRPAVGGQQDGTGGPSATSPVLGPPTTSN